MKRIAALGFLALAACSAPRSPHDLALTGNGAGLTVRIDEGRAYGPGIEVDKYEDGYRGRWGGTISLRVEKDRIIGTRGTQPFDIHFTDEGGILTLQGMAGGTLGNLTVTPSKVDGQFAGCGFELKKTELGYEGLRCGAAITVLRFPEDWADRPAAERAAFLALLLTS